MPRPFFIQNSESLAILQIPKSCWPEQVELDVDYVTTQFLFKKKDVKQSKATLSAPLSYSISTVFRVAAQTAGAFNPDVRIQPIHARIEEPHSMSTGSNPLTLSSTPSTTSEQDVHGIPLVESGTALVILVKFSLCSSLSTVSSGPEVISFQDEDGNTELDKAEKQGIIGISRYTRSSH
ncbi:hypothetical protein L210DRAFT_3511760 [Boletus edulis BED1]|uniref:Uncharacterized protein n=1 Tax=Boletus edulis BED1 TaxID=1328754 RepID=A0AAD4BBP0_BOLED|nr:hypothetical protein L210DRAFT_3511760 [Boletus edulis BED1]